MRDAAAHRPTPIPESETAPPRAHDPVTNRRPAHSARDRHHRRRAESVLSSRIPATANRHGEYYYSAFQPADKATKQQDWSAIGVWRSGGARGDHSDAPRRRLVAQGRTRAALDGHRAISAGGRRAADPAADAAAVRRCGVRVTRVAALCKKSVFVRVRAQNFSPPAVPAASLTGLRRRLRRAQKSAISRAPGSP